MQTRFFSLYARSRDLRPTAGYLSSLPVSIVASNDKAQQTITGRRAQMPATRSSSKYGPGGQRRRRSGLPASGCGPGPVRCSQIHYHPSGDEIMIMSQLLSRELSTHEPPLDMAWPSSSGPAKFSPSAAPTAAPVHGRVPAPEVPGAPQSVEQPTGESPDERSEFQPQVGTGAALALMDVRLHMPTPDVVIMRVSGTVDRRNARLLVELAGKQLHRAPHVVLDLSDVSVLDPQGLTALFPLYQQTMARGTKLHIVGTEHDPVSRQFQATGLAQLFTVDSTADAVIASLPRPVISSVGFRRIGPKSTTSSRHQRKHLQREYDALAQFVPQPAGVAR